MSGATLKQVVGRLGVSVETFKRWEREGKIPPARRVMRATTPVRFFTEAEVVGYEKVIKDVVAGEQIAFDLERDQTWSPFPLPSGQPHT